MLLERSSWGIRIPGKLIPIEFSASILIVSAVSADLILYSRNILAHFPGLETVNDFNYSSSMFFRWTISQIISATPNAEQFPPNRLFIILRNMIFTKNIFWHSRYDVAILLPSISPAVSLFLHVPERHHQWAFSRKPSFFQYFGWTSFETTTFPRLFLYRLRILNIFGISSSRRKAVQEGNYTREQQVVRNNCRYYSAMFQEFNWLFQSIALLLNCQFEITTLWYIHCFFTFLIICTFYSESLQILFYDSKYLKEKTRDARGFYNSILLYNSPPTHTACWNDDDHDVMYKIHSNFVFNKVI